MKYSLTETGTYSTEIPQQKNVGDYDVWYKIEGGNDYADVAPQKIVASILKKALTIKANDKTITYGEAPVDNGVTFTGFADGEDETALTGTLSYSYSYTQYDNVGFYTITPSGLTSENYNITYADGVLAVMEDGVTYTAPAALSLTYNGKDQELVSAGTLTNCSGAVIKFCLTENGTYSDDIPSGMNAGDYEVWYRIDGGNNYSDIAPQKIAASIKKADLTIKANDKEITYGEAPLDNGVTYTGFATGEDEAVLSGTLSYGYDYTQFGNVGTYSITPSGLTSGNYSITFEPGILKVVPKSLTFTWPSDEQSTFIYDGSEKNVAAVAVTVNGDELELTYQDAEKKNAGEYTAKITAISGIKAVNYSFDVNAATLSHTWKIVKESVGAPEVTMNGYKYGETVPTPGIGAYAGDGAVTYYYNTTDSNANGTEWKNITSTTLAAGTYYMYVVIAETDNYNGYTTATKSFAVSESDPTDTPTPSLTEAPTQSPTEAPTLTEAPTTSTTEAPTTTPTPLPYTLDETKTFSDGSKKVTTKTWNEDGTYTEKSVREWKNGNKTTEEIIQDLKTKKTLYSFTEKITFSKKGNETISTSINKADGYRLNSTEKIYTSGTTKLSSTEILADKTRQEITETRTAEGSLSRKIMDTDPEGTSTLTVTVETPVDEPDGSKATVNRTVTKYNVGKDKSIELVSLKTNSESVTIPKSVYFSGKYYVVISISDKAVRNNKSITEVVIGKNVKTIGEKAFYGCTNLENIYIYSKQIETVGKKAFYKISKKAVFHIKAKKKICKNLAKMIKDAGYKGDVKWGQTPLTH